MTAPTFTEERTLQARICLRHENGSQEGSGSDQIMMTCPLPHEDSAGDRFAESMVLHCDETAVWATHGSFCGGRFELDAMVPEITPAVFDRLFRDADPVEPDYIKVMQADPLARHLGYPLCLPRLLGQVEHQHTVGRLPRLERYNSDYTDGTGMFSNARCPKCPATAGFVAEHDVHRRWVWCACGHSWGEPIDERFEMTLTQVSSARGEQAARAAALVLLATAPTTGPMPER